MLFVNNLGSSKQHCLLLIQNLEQCPQIFHLIKLGVLAKNIFWKIVHTNPLTIVVLMKELVLFVKENQIIFLQVPISAFRALFS